MFCHARRVFDEVRRRLRVRNNAIRAAAASSVRLLSATKVSVICFPSLFVALGVVASLGLVKFVVLFVVLFFVLFFVLFVVGLFLFLVGLVFFFRLVRLFFRLC